ncbi:MAG: TonB-dependent receptor plug domain-containing protein [Bacteroidales bacterium]|nr:TonB-dependent receptor plug domain-containing protein [Bacteroidales bacterium]
MVIPAALSGQVIIRRQGFYLRGGGGASDSSTTFHRRHSVVAGTATGTSTNPAGYFSLRKIKGTDKLVASFVGYTPDTLTIAPGDDYLEIFLLENSMIGEVTVIGRATGAHIDRQATIATVNITAAELCKAACCNLSESFVTNPSVDVNYTDAATGAKQIQLLGLAGSYVQILTENIPAMYGLAAAAYGLSYIPGPWMESIQVSKGTSSVRNGNESITGQINVEYKKPATSEIVFVNGFVSDAGSSEPTPMHQ